MKRPALKWPNVKRPAVRITEDAVLTAGFFGGLVLVAAAIALMYLPAGLLVGGLEAATVCGLLSRTGSDEDDE